MSGGYIARRRTEDGASMGPWMSPEVSSHTHNIMLEQVLACVHAIVGLLAGLKERGLAGRAWTCDYHCGKVSIIHQNCERFVL